MKLQDSLTSLLGNQFHIPFNVEKDFSEKEIHLSITPDSSDDKLFSIDAQFKNNIRLVLEFKPQKYAAEMVREMGRATQEQKQLFCLYASQLKSMKADLAFLINDEKQDSSSYQNWPKEWNKICIKVTIRPIEFTIDEKPDYQTTLEKWAPAMVGMSLSLLNTAENDTNREETIVKDFEGKKINISTSKYERSAVNRTLCLLKYGYTCQICGINFEKTYGPLGKDFIHVHHKNPVSQMGGSHRVNPITDLIPVCPNCHAMLHKTNPPLDPEILKKQINTSNE